jgi:hypothetical protein
MVSCVRIRESSAQLAAVTANRPSGIVQLNEGPIMTRGLGGLFGKSNETNPTGFDHLKECYEQD